MKSVAFKSIVNEITTTPNGWIPRSPNPKIPSTTRHQPVSMWSGRPTPPPAGGWRHGKKPLPLTVLLLLEQRDGQASQAGVGEPMVLSRHGERPTTRCAARALRGQQDSTVEGGGRPTTKTGLAPAACGAQASGTAQNCWPRGTCAPPLPLFP
jgi:hypothetical protein